ncbi:hypothetical protein MN608_10863 [Microdochium nivale]|nr:hypothetical protein MN608_10863 [Microdochium nivale]
MALFSSAAEEKPIEEVPVDTKRDKKNKKRDKRSAEDSSKRDSVVRPGTSGTANVLLQSRVEASDNLQKAQRAEVAYLTRKKVALARANYDNTKTHFKEGFSHFGSGFKGLFSAASAVPWLVRERREKHRLAREEVQRKRNLEKKRKLEEALAKHGAGADDDEADN